MGYLKNQLLWLTHFIVIDSWNKSKSFGSLLGQVRYFHQHSTVTLWKYQDQQTGFLAAEMREHFGVECNK